MPSRVFISYRRDDSRYQARMIYEAVQAAVSRQNVFMDIDSIPPGADFVGVLEGWVDQCDIMLVLIGPGWFSICDPTTNRPRLENETDFVRIEVRKALSRGIPVVPLLIDGAAIPREEQLPSDLRALVRRQAEILEYRTFDTDVRRLIGRLGLNNEIGEKSSDLAKSTATALTKLGGPASAIVDRLLRDAEMLKEADASDALMNIGIGLAKSGRTAEALVAADRAKDDKGVTFRCIALEEAKTGNTSEARSLFERARERARSVPDGVIRQIYLCAVAEAEGEAGLIADARRTLELVRQIEFAEQTGDAFKIGQALYHVAQSYSEIGLIEEALENALSIEYQHYKICALDRVASAQFKAGQVNDGRATLEKARKYALSEEDDSSRVSSLTEVANTQIAVGMKKEAAESLNKAVQILGAAEASFVNESAIGDIAEAKAKLGMFKEASQLAGTLKDEHHHDSALNAVARTQAEQGMCSEALKVVPFMKQDFWRDVASTHIAAAYANGGRISDALHVVGSISDATSRAQALCRIGRDLAKSGKKEEACNMFELARKACELSNAASRTRMMLQIKASEAGLWG